MVVLLSGERRIRVHTLCVAVSSQPSHVYAGLNVQAITVVLAMMGKHIICMFQPSSVKCDQNYSFFVITADRSASSSVGDAREVSYTVHVG